MLRLSAKAYQLWREQGVQGVKYRIKRRTYGSNIYQKWVRRYDVLTEDDRAAILKRIEKLHDKPLISVVMPVYNVDERWLRRAIESVRRQLYPFWELYIADDKSPAPHIKKVLKEYEEKEPRIKVTYRSQNGHISAASNSALALVTGEFIALLDHDDELSEHALYMVVEELNAHPEADLIYSDEDKIDKRGRRFEPFFKSDWNRDLFYSLNCISHLGVYRKSVVERIGGFRLGYEGSQDYDLALRIIEQIPEDHIRHIPHVLYHWRSIPGSVALGGGEKQYAHEAARRAIRSHFERSGISAQVTAVHDYLHRVSYTMQEYPLVSIIVKAEERSDLIPAPVKSILERTDYHPFELLINVHQNTDDRTKAFLDEMRNDARVRVIYHDNFDNSAAISNSAIRRSRGEIVATISGNLTVASSEWLEEMVSHAVRPEIGVVGAKLLRADGTVRHAGYILGGKNIAAHAYEQPPLLNGAYWSLLQVIQDRSAVSGDCLLVRREVFDEVGGFDEQNLPDAYGDVDFCLRVRERGYRVLWTPYAELSYPRRIKSNKDQREQTAKARRERCYIEAKLGCLLRNEPYYSPNLNPSEESVLPAFPPRAPKPWRHSD